MLPYGIPRLPQTDCPDCIDLHYFGFKSRKGRLDGKSNIRNVRNKKATRRYWKRKERRRAIKEINDEIYEETSIE